MGAKRAVSTPHGRTSARRRLRAPGSCAASSAETAASRSMRGSAAAVARRVRGWLTSVPCTVSARTPALHGERGPRGEPEVRVHHVESAAAGAVTEAPAQLERASRERARAGRELVQLHLHAAELCERGHLVAHEAAALGVRGVGAHVRYHERAHDPPTVAL